MKKSLCIVLSVLMILVSFAACGGNNDIPQVTTSVDEQGSTYINVTNPSGQAVTDTSGNAVTEVSTQTTKPSTPSGDIPAGFENILDENGEFNPNAKPEDLLPEGDKIKKTTLRDDIIGDTIKTKKFTMTMVVLGQDAEIPTKVTMDGDKIGAALSLDGMDAKILAMDGKTYLAFTYMTAKLYMETDEETYDMSGILNPTGDEDVEYIKTTTVEENGKTYTCEEYKSESGIITKYYFLDKQWVRQEVIDGDVVSISEIRDFKGTADKSVFDLTGYKKLDAATIENSFGNSGNK